tara:strand:+ start:97 stop:357 length:261 start_codon:yes stop_codon:yes gene_type:complete
MSDVNIQEHMGAAINARVKEVLEFYLNGTPEEFESASRAVMNELSSMGDALHGIVQVDNIDLNDAEDRESLAKQLTSALRESKGWD